ncbi:MAG TPA: acriflavin resistance protein, partial [Maribacter sp.]|nr:acriflavin resistance protein [Maribacter sp.]
LLQKETAPYDDRSYVRLVVNAPEGSSYEYMDRLMTDITELINDSVPEKKVSLVLTSPGFGSSSVNSGRANIALVDPSERDRSQREIANDLGEWAKAYVGGKSNVSERPTISVNRRGGPPIQYIIQAQNFDKLKEYIPEFMAEAEN